MITSTAVQDCKNKNCSTFSQRPHEIACTHYRGIITSRQLRLADVVDLGGVDGYSYATVSQIKEGMITFFKPYVHTSDFSYTGGVICYIGIEQFSVYQDSDRTYKLVGRKELK